MTAKGPNMDEMRSFYKAAGRAGLSDGLPAQYRNDIAKEIEEEDALAPMPSALSTPRVTPRLRTSGGPPQAMRGRPTTPVQFMPPSSQTLELTATHNTTANQSNNEEGLASKYFTSAEIEAIKFQRLQDIAAGDRRQVMSVLTPVVSLLDGLNLSAGEDQQLVADIKTKLANIAGPGIAASPVPSARAKTAKDKRSNGFNLKGCRTSAIQPINGDKRSGLDKDANDEDEMFKPSFAEKMSTGCGWLRIVSAWTKGLWTTTEPTLAEEEEVPSSEHYETKHEENLASTFPQVNASPSALAPHLLQCPPIYVTQRVQLEV